MLKDYFWWLLLLASSPTQEKRIFSQDLDGILTKYELNLGMLLNYLWNNFELFTFWCWWIGCPPTQPKWGYKTVIPWSSMEITRNTPWKNTTMRSSQKRNPWSGGWCGRWILNPIIHTTETTLATFETVVETMQKPNKSLFQWTPRWSWGVCLQESPNQYSDYNWNSDANRFNSYIFWHAGPRRAQARKMPDNKIHVYLDWKERFRSFWIQEDTPEHYELRKSMYVEYVNALNKLLRFESLENVLKVSKILDLAPSRKKMMSTQ